MQTMPSGAIEMRFFTVSEPILMGSKSLERSCGAGLASRAWSCLPACPCFEVWS
jgi:hypothetical protein